jgi:hypothetical protein
MKMPRVWFYNKLIAMFKNRANNILASKLFILFFVFFAEIEKLRFE